MANDTLQRTQPSKESLKQVYWGTWLINWFYWPKFATASVKPQNRTFFYIIPMEGRNKQFWAVRISHFACEMVFFKSTQKTGSLAYLNDQLGTGGKVHKHQNHNNWNWWDRKMNNFWSKKQFYFWSCSNEGMLESFKERQAVEEKLLITCSS